MVSYIITQTLAFGVMFLKGSKRRTESLGYNTITSLLYSCTKISYSELHLPKYKNWFWGHNPYVNASSARMSCCNFSRRLLTQGIEINSNWTCSGMGHTDTSHHNHVGPCDRLNCSTSQLGIVENMFVIRLWNKHHNTNQKIKIQAIFVKKLRRPKNIPVLWKELEVVWK